MSGDSPLTWPKGTACGPRMAQLRQRPVSETATAGDSPPTWPERTRRWLHGTRPTAKSQHAVGDVAAAEARNLVGRERRAGELVAQVKGAEEVDDVVHSLLHVRPVARAA